MLRFMAFCLLMFVVLLFGHGAASAALLALSAAVATPCVWLAWMLLGPPADSR